MTNEQSCTSEPRGQKYAFLVGLGIFFSRIAGLIRDRIFAHFFGNSAAADAFKAAFRIPNFLQNLFGEGTLSASFIPVYAKLLAQKNEKEAGEVAGAIAATLALVVSVLVLVGILSTPILTAIIAPGFTGEKRELTIRLVRILFPGAGFLVFSAWCLGVLNSHRRFFMSYAAPVVWNLVMIVSLLSFGNRLSQFPLAETLAWASVIGSAMQFLVQLPMALRLAKRLRVTLGWHLPSVRTVIRNFTPVFIGRGVLQISGYIEELLASLLPTGAFAALSYAITLYLLPISLFGMSVSASELPAMSSALGDDRQVAAYLNKRLNNGLRQIAFFIIPSAIVFLFLGNIIVAAIYQTGQFTRDDTNYVWVILAGYAIGLLATTLGRLYVSAYYALHDTRTPVRYAILRVALTASMGYLLALHAPELLGITASWGVVGLSFSAGISGWIELALLRHTLNNRIGRTGLPASFTLKLLAAAGAAALVGIIAARTLPITSPIPLAAAVFLPYGLVYFGLAALFRIPEMENISRSIFRVIKRK